MIAVERVCFWGTRYDLKRRSEEHTSELQSRLHLVCRLLLEKKNVVTALSISLDCPCSSIQGPPLIRSTHDAADSDPTPRGNACPPRLSAGGHSAEAGTGTQP